MAQSRLNLGIVAHVDAGKTTLTERLLYAAGVIDTVGSVDQGTTQTDSLALEQQRGITIKSAVVSFAIDDVEVNLIDTPGHPDFVAEVERVLNVLDGTVLVISAVEGVQPQTRLLMRALERLRIPTLLFVNKIDRPGAGYERVLEAITERLTPAIVPMGVVDELGTRAATFAPWSAGESAFRTRLTEVLAEQDDSILAAYVEEDGISRHRVRDALATQTGQALVHPVFFGSAITGAGVQPLMAGIAELLPAAEGDADGPVSGLVFKIERGPGGEKIAYVRMFSGTIRTRDRLRFGDEVEAKVTRIDVFDRGDAARAMSVSAGEIGKLWGLAEIRVGDAIGTPRPAAPEHHFDPPTLETVVAPNNADDGARLHVALGQLAEQDPLINVRQDDTRHEISVSLYGEVQKEVIEATLAGDFGLDVTFRETTTICVERPIRSGEAVELLHAESNPFFASLGVRIDPAPDDSGVAFRQQVDDRTVPLYLYKTVDRFTESIGDYVRETLQEGLFGWRVTDCVVTLTECTYSVPDGPPSRRGPLSTAADFRKLTPLVVMQALEQAGTVVCEPVVRASLELPTDALGAVMSTLGRLGAAVEAPSLQGTLSKVGAVLSAAHAQDLQRQLPGLTGGEGVLESSFAGYQAVSGDQPTRPRTTANPLNLGEYMLHLARRVSGA
ncbi:MAG: TetM/TetW/TetO/TetS family tetracycline resistance ribosomal protection protein [Actinobacteria bacterium]|nr:MAG: TetM/TetW/TetO/TetS family tetracycline resistance ribosomal protection protein [Actinomycetota bacterium]